MKRSGQTAGLTGSDCSEEKWRQIKKDTTRLDGVFMMLVYTLDITSTMLFCNEK